jgi:predicted nucleic acid-binding protein
MMVLVDTTVMVDWLRGRDARLSKLLPTLPVAICGVTRAEILHGARDPAHRTRLLAQLAGFPLVPIPDPLWTAVGDNLAILRSRGVTVPFQDAVIASLALVNDIEVWARDRHFPDIQLVIPTLKLFQEPP